MKKVYLEYIEMTCSEKKNISPHVPYWSFVGTKYNLFEYPESEAFLIHFTKYMKNCVNIIYINAILSTQSSLKEV